MSALALTLGASPALAGNPAIHDSFSPVGIVIHCDSSEYTIMSGLIAVVLHSNDDFATGHSTYTPRNVLVQKNDQDGNPGGASYRVVGAKTHGVEASASNGGPAVLDTFKYRILGTGNSVNIEVHSDGSGGYYEVNRGTCEAPAG